jgi:hypothetical protein
MANVKTIYHNDLLLTRFISMFGINPNLINNKEKLLQLLEYGKIAAYKFNEVLVIKLKFNEFGFIA